jgi:hypothetical protein
VQSAPFVILMPKRTNDLSVVQSESFDQVLGFERASRVCRCLRRVFHFEIPVSGPGTSLGERSDPSGSAVLARDVARDVGLEVSRDCGRGGVLTIEVGPLTVEPTIVEPAMNELATLEPPMLRLDLCFAICSEIEDITDGDRDLTEPPFEEWIEILRSRSSTGDFVLALSS